MDLQDVIKKVLREEVDVLNQRIERAWATYDKGRYTDHKAYKPDIVFTENDIDALLQYTGMGAWIMEYGSGSLMTTSRSAELGNDGNPWLSEYFSDSMFNNERRNNGLAFTGRSKGDLIYAPDGSIKVSTGKRKGINLEKLLPPKVEKEFAPQMPLHLIETEIQLWANELQEHLADAIEDYLVDTFDKAFET